MSFGSAAMVRAVAAVVLGCAAVVMCVRRAVKSCWVGWSVVMGWMDPPRWRVGLVW